MTSNDYIAVFDSGVGGISVLQNLRRLMPKERYLYFGDCANAPYGTRATWQVRELTLAAVKALMTGDPVKALVVACNTATSAAIKDLRGAYPALIVVGIEPALKLAADRYPGGRIGVMATEVTLREEKFDNLVQRFHAGCAVTKIPAPGLVELVEAGKGETPEAEALLRPVLEPYRGALDALVLGCTHYPFAAGTIRKILGPGTELLHGGEGTARETRRRLVEAGLLGDGSREGCVVIKSSLPGSGFAALADRLLREEERV